MEYLFPYPKMGESWLEILEDPLTRKLLGHDAEQAEKIPFIQGVQSRFKFLSQDPLKHLPFAKIGYTALEAFLQANCTGPPLDFDSIPVVIPKQYRSEEELAEIRQQMFEGLKVDGIDIYPLTQRVELFWLAKTVMDNQTLAENGFNPRRARFRINFWHQKLLSEHADSLQNTLYHDADVLDGQFSSRLIYGGAAAQEHMVEFLVERANVRIFYGDELKAREDLLRAAKLREFDFALIGALGKKTKFQQKDTSQLVVMAKSRDHEPEPYSSRKSSRADVGSRRKSSIAERSLRSMSLQSMSPVSPQDQHSAYAFPDSATMLPMGGRATHPENLPLNDDTLLEQIQFNHKPLEPPDPTTHVVTEQSRLPASLAFMDPNDQPILFPMDSIILLAIASSISNTQAADGLTREETLPYASRVMTGGSSNWTVYTQALLIRSRIEGYNSRTTERGLLQLQALVDQIIAETTGTATAEGEKREDGSVVSKPTSFLPSITVEEQERATVAERLRYIHQVSPPLRWELESELAARWTQMGGLKTALEIYERLQMHAEVALCLAATDREAEASSRLKDLLFANPKQEMKDGDVVSLQQPLPAEAPRLLCILGDIESQPKYYNLSWQVSNSRYARAQRSLGSFYVKNRDLPSAIQAYTTALKIARLDISTWFSLGCIYLETHNWQGAVEAFTRVVQLEDRDAQGWSNLAVALLKLPPPPPSSEVTLKAEPAINENPVQPPLGSISESDAVQPHISHPAERSDYTSSEKERDPYQHTYEALRALRRAANLKRDDARIWDNYLTVAASIPPSDDPLRSTPWQEVIHAMSQVIRLRQAKEGEGSIDLKVLDAIVEHVTSTFDYPSEDEDENNGENDALHETEERTDALEDVQTPPDQPEPPQPSASRSRLPFLARALLTLVDTQITPLATSSPALYLLLSKVALWRDRPAESLSLIEKHWRATTGALNASPAAMVAATGTLVNAYKALGPMERERTGGPVEKGWKFKSRTAVRSVMGKAKDVWDDKDEYRELEGMMEDLKKESDG